MVDMSILLHLIYPEDGARDPRTQRPSKCSHPGLHPFSVPGQGSNVTFDWSYSDPSAQISGNGTATISIDFDETFSGGTLSVTATGLCGTSSASTLAIDVASKEFCALAQCSAYIDILQIDNTLLNTTGAPDVFHANKILKSNATILQDNSIVFKAGREIQLDPGFTVQWGAIFSAEIEARLTALTAKD